MPFLRIGGQYFSELGSSRCVWGSLVYEAFPRQHKTGNVPKTRTGPILHAGRDLVGFQTAGPVTPFLL